MASAIVFTDTPASPAHWHISKNVGPGWYPSRHRRGSAYADAGPRCEHTYFSVGKNTRNMSNVRTHCPLQVPVRRRHGGLCRCDNWKARTRRNRLSETAAPLGCPQAAPCLFLSGAPRLVILQRVPGAHVLNGLMNVLLLQISREPLRIFEERCVRTRWVSHGAKMVSYISKCGRDTHRRGAFWRSWGVGCASGFANSF